MKGTKEEELTKCYHCGESCSGDIFFDQHVFCCSGCKTVYEILNENNLCDYYSLNDKPGSSLKGLVTSKRLAYLDDDQVKNKLLQFSNDSVSSVTFYIAKIHCSSCIYLLENLHKLSKGVVRSNVHFTHKTVTIGFNHQQLSLRQLVELLASIGYEPQISLNDLDGASKKNSLRNYYIKTGIAFFAFGNIMLLTFPEYLGIGLSSESPLRRFFNYLNFLLSLPIVFYCASEFFISTWHALKQRRLNMDTPIALGIAIMFLRSSYEIFSQTGSGYFDTLGGLILLMLIGRYFQNKTYETLSFERDYKSYFPIAVSLIKNGIEVSTPLSKLTTGNRILVRNQELIPADSVLISPAASIDYSFVTGEATSVSKQSGNLIYAGGKNAGISIELETVKDVSQSYLTQLWNDAVFEKGRAENISSLATRLSYWFTPAVILIALAAAIYWGPLDFHRALNAFTSVLIITCPCALALSSPFTYGHMIRRLGRHQVYLKNSLVIERIAKITAIVFDKTGTLTNTTESTVKFEGTELSDYELKLIKSLAFHSSHPLSKRLHDSLNNVALITTSDFKETEGKGIEGWIDENYVQLGSDKFLSGDNPASTGFNSSFRNSSRVYVGINTSIRGYFEIKNTYRSGLGSLLTMLKRKTKLFVASGDNDGEKEFLKQYIDQDSLVFHQQPADKLKFIQQLQKEKEVVMMVGDGLNDAGALKQADVGIAVSENINNFSPACDGIIEASRFVQIKDLIDYCHTGVNIIKFSFVISLLYNVIGCTIAVQGNMNPLFAAILMPVSSTSIILFTALASSLAAPKTFRKAD